jgi:RNA polymerase sigma-70 factor (ECF subfamily)
MMHGVAMETSNEVNLDQFAADVDLYHEQLVMLYWQPLKAFIVSRTGSLQDAEDIVQEAFIRAYLALDHYTLEQIQTLKVRPWLYKITWNVFCNHVKRSKLSSQVYLEALEENSPFEQSQQSDEHPEQAFEQVEQRQELETLVATLPQNYRVPVSMYYFEELRYREIAEILQQPVGTVKVYVHRGIQMLRKALTIPRNEVR